MKFFLLTSRVYIISIIRKLLRLTLSFILNIMSITSLTLRAFTFILGFIRSFFAILHAYRELPSSSFHYNTWDVRCILEVLPLKTICAECGTFRVYLSCLLLWIALTVNELNYSILIIMFLFSAPIDNQTTYTDYNTQIIEAKRAYCLVVSSSNPIYWKLIDRALKILSDSLGVSNTKCSEQHL